MHAQFYSIGQHHLQTIMPMFFFNNQDYLYFYAFYFEYTYAIISYSYQCSTFPLFSSIVPFPKC